MPDYDILIYHDLADTNSDAPAIRVGANGRELGYSDELQVVAVGDPIHGGKDATIVLAHSNGPMPGIQALLDRG
jgi:hypothetical protein